MLSSLSPRRRPGIGAAGIALLATACAGGPTAVERLASVSPPPSPVAAPVAGPQPGPPEPVIVDDFALLDDEGKHHELYRQDLSKAVVLVSYGVGCPILRWSLPRVEELAERYADDGVTFFYVDANVHDTRDDIAREAEEFELDVPILHDSAQLVLGALDVERTAEAIVIDTRDWRIVYRGRIDDRATYGAQRSTVTQHDLRDALDELLAGEPISVPRTDAQGCIILYDDSDDAVPPSYAADVAPILVARCVTCHSEGGVAPWAMSSWERVRGWAPMMREAIRTRRMPPWHADPHYGEFSNSRALTPREANTIVRWIEGGAQRGSGEDPLPAASVRQPVEWHLGPPDLILESPEQELPATGIVPYRYARADIRITEDVWVKGVDIQPSNYAVLHHSVILLRYPKHLRDQEPEYLQGVGSYFALYIPGMEPRMYPEGTGKLIPAGSRVIFQFHYTTTGKPEVDRTRVALYLHDEPPPITFESTSAILWDFKIPPGEPRYETVAKKEFETDVLLYDLIPHMHYRGRTMDYQAHLPDGSVETLLSIPRYDFNWQTSYQLAEPRWLPAGTVIVCNAVYDNSDRNPFNPDPTAEVVWGPQSDDEMMIGYMNFHEALQGGPRANDGSAAGADG